MLNLHYKTRGGTDPHGKSRVFFACHPQDFDRTFQQTADWLFQSQNCAIWYLEPQEAEALDEQTTAELLDRFSEIQLFVVPITTVLLTKDNYVTALIPPYSQEHHIPILPLMLETGLVELFRRHFGDREYLKTTSTDPTALPFEQRLAQYLNSVLVGDELAERIRAAFDAYIFLSHRKKNRAEA